MVFGFSSDVWRLLYLSSRLWYCGTFKWYFRGFWLLALSSYVSKTSGVFKRFLIFQVTFKRLLCLSSRLSYCGILKWRSRGFWLLTLSSYLSKASGIFKWFLVLSSDVLEAFLLLCSVFWHFQGLFQRLLCSTTLQWLLTLSSDVLEASLALLSNVSKASGIFNKWRLALPSDV